MKAMKKLASLLLALVMALALAVPAFAVGTYSIIVTNTNKSISINGKTYYAYKLFDATYSGDNVAYTVSEAFKAFTYTVDGVNYQGNALITYLGTLTNDADALDAFAKAALKYATDNEIAAAGSAEAANETAVIGLPAPGYYLVTGTATAPDNQTVTAACALTTAKPTAEVNVKADAPSVDKKIVEGEQKVAANTASIGDSVNYEITSKVPDMKGYAKYFFVMEDTLSKGLTYNEDMVIKIGDTTLTKDTGYTLKETNNADGTTSLEIVFKNFIQYTAGAAIKVTYSATLNQDAELDPTIGNPNKVKLIYSNNPNEVGTGEEGNPDKPGPGDVTGKTPESETKTYVTGIKITKVDGKDTSKTLTGAKFKIEGNGVKVVLINKTIYQKADNGTYYMLKDGSYTDVAPVTDKNADGYNADKYDSITTKYEKVTVVTKDTVPTQINTVGYVDKDGVLIFEGLGEGTYTIKEIIAPNGYNLLKDEITVKIEATEKTLNGCTWTVTVNDETKLTIGEDHLFAFNVVNNAGKELPSTGGIGTTIFYVVGSVLVIGAAVVLITRKRMGKSDK